jgi:hypothetical protein
MRISPRSQLMSGYTLAIRTDTPGVGSGPNPSWHCTMPARLKKAVSPRAGPGPATSRRVAAAPSQVNRHRIRPTRLAAAICLALPACLVGSGCALAGSLETARDEAHAPAPGTVERRQILAALRDEVRRWHKLEVVFVVDELRVVGNWAWIWTRPESPDGRNHYEGVGGLLHREQDQWRVVEFGTETVETLQQRYPDLPEVLLNGR